MPAPIVSPDIFAQAQTVLAVRGRGSASTSRTAMHAYAFGGSMFCGVCERCMQGQWINQAPYYRCRSYRSQ